MSVRADAATFASIPIFSECEPVHLQLLAFSSERKMFQPGENVVTEGINGNAACLILNGEVELLSGGQPIGSAGPGAFLGEIAMVADRPYAITARALGIVTVTRIDRELFFRVAKEYPAFGKSVFKAIALKLDGSLEDLEGARVALGRARSFRSL